MSVRDVPPIDSLICFEAVARLLSFRAAARAVALTPAALSQRIKQLEQQLDAQLFVRSTRSVQVTAAGRALLPVARACIASGRECVEAVRLQRGPAPIELTVGTRFELGLSWLVPELDALERHLPHVTIHLFFGSGPELIERLRRRQLDCAITSARLAHAQLDALRLHEERYVLVGAPALLDARPLETVEDAGAHTLFDIDPSLPLLRYLQAGLPGATELRFGGTRFLGAGAAILARVHAGRGVAVLPRYMVQRDLRAGRLVHLLPTLEASADYFKIVFRADDARRDAYETLAEVLRQTPIR